MQTAFHCCCSSYVKYNAEPFLMPALAPILVYLKQKSALGRFLLSANFFTNNRE